MPLNTLYLRYSNRSPGDCRDFTRKTFSGLVAAIAADSLSYVPMNSLLRR